MTVDRGVWKGGFTPDGVIRWPCPACHLPRLKLIPETLHKVESKESLGQRAHPAWEPEWIHARFVCLLKCQECDQSMAVLGKQGVELGEFWNDEKGDLDGDYFETFQPTFVFPAPPLIEIPTKVPDDVKEQLTKSFQLFWSDAESCANRVRASVEKLLNSLKIKRKRIAKSGKRIPLSLHERIQEFEAKDRSLAENLMAVKWLGNAGAHSSPVHVDDLLDGYEILEHVLSEIFTQRTRRIADITKQINRKRMPRSAQKKR